MTTVTKKKAIDTDTLAVVDSYREQENLYAMLYSEGGAGKTLTALKMALALTDGDASKILVIDTDARRSRHYAPSRPGADDGIAFKAIYLDTFAPGLLVESLKLARSKDFRVVIVDSMSKFWNGPGGLVELNQRNAQRYFGGNSQAAWSKTNEDEYRIHSAIDEYLAATGHVILCCQQRLEYKSGTLDVVGVKAEFRANLGHRPNLIGRMELSEPDDNGNRVNRMVVEKSTLTRLKVDGVQVDSRPIFAAGTSFDAPGANVANDALSHLHAGVQDIDYDTKLAAYLSMIEGYDRNQLLDELGAVAAKPWPGYVKDEAREAITALGVKLKHQQVKVIESVSVADSPEVVDVEQLTTESTAQQWQDAIDACVTREQVEALQEHAKAVDMFAAHQANLVKRWKQLPAPDDATQADTVSA